MTKHFCDLCGNPAAEDYPEYFQDGVEGLFGKKAGVRAVFEVVHDSGNVIRRETPDLCASCQVHFLRRLSEQIQSKQ